MDLTRRTGALVVAFIGLVAVAVVLAVASWVGEDPVASEPVAEPSSLTPALPTPSPTPTVGTVQLAFAGDVHFEEFLATALAADPQGLLAGAAPLFDGADQVVVNLETAITTRGRKWPKMYNFRAPPIAYEALLAAGVDAVSLANNHTLDWGEVGLRDTLDHARAAGMPTFGAGVDLASALRPHSVTIRGQRIAYLGAAEVLTDEAWVARDATDEHAARPGMPGAKAHHLDVLLPAVEAAAATHDVVVVFLHWGQETNNCPIARQTDLAPKLAAAGATIIVGAHAHRVQGFGMVDGAVVQYGLGNFVWYTLGNEGGRSETGVLHVRIDPDGTMTAEWRPAEITRGLPAPVPADELPAYEARMDGYRACAGFGSDG